MCITHKAFITKEGVKFHSVETKALKDDNNQVVSRTLNYNRKYAGIIELGFKDFNREVNRRSENSDVVTIGYDKIDGDWNEAVVLLNGVNKETGDRIFYNLEEEVKGNNSYRAVPPSNIRYLIFNKIKYVNKSDRKTTRR